VTEAAVGTVLLAEAALFATALTIFGVLAAFLRIRAPWGAGRGAPNGRSATKPRRRNASTAASRNSPPARRDRVHAPRLPS
jgi:hypothetical protein